MILLLENCSIFECFEINGTRLPKKHFLALKCIRVAINSLMIGNCLVLISVHTLLHIHYLHISISTSHCNVLRTQNVHFQNVSHIIIYIYIYISVSSSQKNLELIYVELYKRWHRTEDEGNRTRILAISSH